MKYIQFKAFEKHLKDAAPSHFSPLYLLIAAGDFERKEAILTLTHSLLGEMEPDPHNRKVFEGGKISIQEVVQELYGLSLFAKKRVVILQGVEELKKEELFFLESYFMKPQPDITLVLAATSVNRSTRFYKLAEKAGVILELETEKPWEKEATLTEKVLAAVKREGKRMEPATASVLVKMTDAEPAVLFQELEKLLCYVGEREEIVLGDLHAVCAFRQTETVWQLGEALCSRQAAQVLSAAEQLMQKGESVFGLLRQLRSQLQSRLLAATESPEEIGRRYPYLKGNLLQKQIQQAKQYGLNSCKRALLLIDAAELEAKNSALPQELLLEKLLFKLLVSP